MSETTGWVCMPLKAYSGHCLVVTCIAYRAPTLRLIAIWPRTLGGASFRRYSQPELYLASSTVCFSLLALALRRWASRKGTTGMVSPTKRDVAPWR